MSIKGKGAYAGKHWMQDPANKEKVMKMIAKMQRGGRRARKAGTYGKKQRELRTHPMKVQAIAHEIVSRAKRSYSPRVARILKEKEQKEMVLVINGWRVTLGKGTVRIDND